MAKQQGKILLLAGAGALLLLSSGKKKKRKPTKQTETKAHVEEDLDEVDGGFNVEDGGFEEPVERPAPPVPPSPPAPEPDFGPMIDKYLAPHGRAQLGALYQIKPGDTPLEVCREALFGSRAPVTEPALRQAAMDLLVRIDCGPWNQAVNGVDFSHLSPGHAQIDGYWTQRGVSFNPIYSNNLERMRDLMPPTSAPGKHFALIWIPMINLDKFDLEGIVTTEGMYHPDTEEGQGPSMIDPPVEITNLGFEQVSNLEVGCDLPEGDFRKTVIAS